MQKTILVLGGDKRFKYLSALLCEHYRVLSVNEEHDELFIRRYMREADIIVLPIPITFDGITLNAPFIEQKIMLGAIVSNLLPDQLLLTGGALPEGLGSVVCKTRNYTKSESFLLGNAELTAEGLLKIVIEELPMSLKNSNIAITGYGRVGRATAKLLKKVGCGITVFDRNPCSRDSAEKDGLIPADFTDFIRLGHKFDCVINTVPTEVIGEDEMESLKKTCLLCEAASAPYGFDFKSADKHNLKHMIAGSLPGKTSPVTAAQIIYESVLKEDKNE